MNIIDAILSIVTFGLALLPLAIVIDMVKNNDRSPYIILFVLQFGTTVYFGLLLFLKSIGFLWVL